MTDTNNAAAKVAKKTVGDDMDARRIFDTTDEAMAYLGAASDSFSDFADIPFAGVGIIDVDGAPGFDPEVYTDQMQIMVSVLRKGPAEKGGKSSVKAVVVAPIPTFDSILADESAKAWAWKILQKEMNHVAVRPLRDAEDVSTVLDQMPKTLTGYTTSGRESGGMIETFNELFKGINATLASKSPVWSKARLIKSDLKKAMESKAYAEEYFPALENRGEGKDSLFVVAINLGISAAKVKGLDPQIFQRWADSRDQKTFTAAEEADDFDIDSMSSELIEDEKKPAATA